MAAVLTLEQLLEFEHLELAKILLAVVGELEGERQGKDQAFEDEYGRGRVIEIEPIDTDELREFL